MKDNVTELAEKILVAMYTGGAIKKPILSEHNARVAWLAAKALYEVREKEPYTPKKPEAF